MRLVKMFLATKSTAIPLPCVHPSYVIMGNLDARSNSSRACSSICRGLDRLTGSCTTPTLADSSYQIDMLLASVTQ